MMFSLYSTLFSDAGAVREFTPVHGSPQDVNMPLQGDAPVAPQDAEPRTPHSSDLVAATPVQWATPPSIESATASEGPRRYRTLKNIYDNTKVQELTESFSELCLLAAEEPSSFSEAEKLRWWQEAMQEELNSIESNQTWQLVDPPAGVRPIGLKWIFKIKRNAQGEVVKHKARLVAKGFVQQQGVDFEEVFAPVARMETVRLLLALAARKGWEVHHMDVKSAFLNGDLQEEVYVCQPPGFVDKKNAHKVLRLNKALYRLRQAPRAWNVKLDNSLLSLGFERSSSEAAVYRRGMGSSSLLVGVYVDDLIIMGAQLQEIHKFKQEMKKLFSMSDLGLLSYYLGMEVHQTKEAITVNQSAYARKVLEKAGLNDCNSCQVPMDARLKLSKVSNQPPANINSFRSLVGSLRYLVHTRPDISYSVSYVSRFMEAPTREHMAAVKQILRYIKGTMSFGCCYRRNPTEELNLIGFSDSDMAGDVDDRKSTSGVLFMMGGDPVSWQSQKQKVVALSSCEAEYIAATTAACQGIWLARLLGEMMKEEPRCIKLWVDNKSAIALSKNPVFHDRSKHIDTRYHFVRQCVEEEKIEIEFISSEHQLADILTKPLGRVRFLELRSKLGLIEVK